MNGLEWIAEFASFASSNACVRQANIPLMPLVKALGATDKQLQESWGLNLWETNAKHDTPAAFDKLHARFVRSGQTGADLKLSAESWASTTVMRLGHRRQPAGCWYCPRPPISLGPCPTPLSSPRSRRSLTRLPKSDEQARRDWAVQRAIDLGRSGMIAVHEATGIALEHASPRHQESAIWEHGTRGPPARPGAGRHAKVDDAPGLLKALYRLLEPHGHSAGQAPLCWTCKSSRRLAGELAAKGHGIGATTVLVDLEARRLPRRGQSADLQRPVRPRPPRPIAAHSSPPIQTAERSAAVAVELYAGSESRFGQRIGV